MNRRVILFGGPRDGEIRDHDGDSMISPNLRPCGEGLSYHCEDQYRATGEHAMVEGFWTERFEYVDSTA